MIRRGLIVLYGDYMGLTDGVQRACLATLIPDHRGATGFGLYHMVVERAILPARAPGEMVMGSHRSGSTIWFGAATSALAMTIFVVFGVRLKLREEN